MIGEEEYNGQRDQGPELEKVKRLIFFEDFNFDRLKSDVFVSEFTVPF